MAILIVEYNGTVEGASLSGRILIGRRPSNHVVVDDPAVSRIHAWVDTADRQFCITDAGSRTGTFVNGQRVAGKLELTDGDRISIGPASLIFRADGSLPAGASQLNFDGRTGEGDGGMLFDCTCGAPLWIASAFAGRLGKCRFCGAVMQVPDRPGIVSSDDFVAPVASLPHAASSHAAPAVSSARTKSCGVCQSSIQAGESSTACPACGLTFHADCWAENFGCSAYGCSQVNALVPKAHAGETLLFNPDASFDAQPDSRNGLPELSDAPPGSHAALAADVGAAHAPRIPPEHALLAGSVAGLLLGSLTFGVPALLALAAVVVYVIRRRRRGRGHVSRVVVAAALLAAAGVVAGAAVSYVWWVRGIGPADDGIGVWSEQT